MNKAGSVGGQAHRAGGRLASLATPLLALLALLWLCPAVSQAEDEDDSDYARPGVYLGLGVVGASYPKADDSLDNSDFDEAVGLTITAGLRATAHFAAELEVEILTKSDIDISGFAGEGEMHSTMVSLNMKGYPLTGRIQPYALVGVGGQFAKLEVTGTSDETPSGFAARFGGGVEIYLTPIWVLDFGVDYVLPGDGKIEDLDYVSYGGGLVVRF